MSTVTVQSVVNFASTQTGLMPLVGVGGFANEPAISIANDVLSELLAPPFAWKFNRKQMALFTTQQNQQDYQFAGATAWTANGGVSIDLASNNAIVESGNTVTVKTLGAHNFAVGATVFMTGNTVADYNSVFSTSPSAGSLWTGGWVITAVTATTFSFVHVTSGLANSGAPGITNCSWLESGSMVNMNDTASAQYIWYLDAVRTLQPSSRGAIPGRVCVVSDDGAGILTIRLQYLPGPQPFGITLIYQARPALLSSLSSTWAPFPDEYAFAYRQMFLALALRYANSPRSEVEYKKAQSAVLKSLGANDREQTDEFIVPAGGSIMGAQVGVTSGWPF